MSEQPRAEGGRRIHRRYSVRLQDFALVLLLPFSLLSLGRGIQNALSETPPGRSTDLYPYWLGGYRITLHQDPYRQAIASDEVPLERTVAGLGAVRSINNLPPMLLFLVPVSFLPWPVAKLVVASLNTTLALWIPWIPLRWIAGRLALTSRLGLALAFYALLPTRNAIANGQTSLLVVALGLIAIDLAFKNQIVAGLLLGLALSRFSILLPLLLWFALYHRHQTILIALAVQAAGWVGLSALSRAAPWTLLESYRRGLALAAESYAPRADQFGTLALFDHLHLPEWGGYLAAVAVFLVATASLAPWIRQEGIHSAVEKTQDGDSVGQILAAALLIVLPIPLLFHAAYDAVGMVMLPVALLAARSAAVASGDPSPASLGRATLLAIAAGVAFLLPGVGSTGATSIWRSAHPILLTLASLWSLGVLIWLCRRYPGTLRRQGDRPAKR